MRARLHGRSGNFVIKTDFLVIGGGVIGVNVARAIKRRHPDVRVILLEKEPGCGLHASGRNSGVLHAGFYYSPDSLKARFTRMGNIAMTDYCRDRGIRINACGKLVVARDEGDLPQMDELLKRGRANGVPLDELSEAEAKSIEPRVKTCGRALYSSTTASVDPSEVMRRMGEDAVHEGVEIHTGVSYLKLENGAVMTSSGRYGAGYVINAAGLYADKVAKDFGFSDHYSILPFKGLYLYSDEPKGAIRTNIYPVPDLRNPFLGVHYTLTVNNDVKIGPTAIPVLWREQYQGLENFSPGEFLEIVYRQLGLFARSNFDFKKLAMEEIRKYSRTRMVELASVLVEGVDSGRYRRWAKPGIRAQLLDHRTKKLEMDFVIEGDAKSLHILNAVSPAFTCSIPFSEHVCDQIDRLLH
ncbi:MAG: L-2-hydroxyglutarate oxidase [Gammaproteobacteria bacterium]|nr:L-2-hydroxyglutarate oxidase [Gammaproteobacteria bacterium]